MAHGGGSVHVWGGISHMGKTSLCVLDQMSLEPFIADFWRNTWFDMAGHGIATIGYWLMIISDFIGLVQWMLTSMNKTSSAWIGPLSSGYELNRTYLGRNLEELDPQSVNLWQQIPLERVQTLVSSMPLVDLRGELHAILNCRYIGTDIEMISCKQ